MAIATVLTARAAGAGGFGALAVTLGVTAIVLDLGDAGSSAHLARLVARREMLASKALAIGTTRIAFLTLGASVIVGGSAVIGSSPRFLTAAVVFAAGQALTLALVPLLRAAESQTLASVLALSERACGLVILLILVQHGGNPAESYLIGFGIGPLLSCGVVIRVAGFRVPRLVSARMVIRTIWDARHFGVVSVMTDLSNLETPAVTSLSGNAAAGQFAIANRLTGLLGMPASVAAAVLAPRFASESPVVAANLLSRARWALAVGYAALGLAVVAGAGMLVPLILGRSFGPDTVECLRLAALAVAIGAVNQITNSSLVARNGAAFVASSLSISLVSGLIAVGLGSWLYGAVGASLGVVAKEFIVMVVLAILSRRAAPTRPARVTVVEPSAEGHRLSYVARLASEGRRCGYRIRILTSGRAHRSPQWSEFLAHVEEAECQVLDDSWTIADGRWRKSVERDYVVILDGEHWLPSAAWRRGPRGGGTLLLMRPRSQGVRGWLQYWVKALLAGFAVLHGWRVCVLASPVGTSRRLLHPGLRWYPQVKDPLPARREVVGNFRQAHNIADETILALCAGSIDSRKSPREIVAWVETSGNPRVAVAFVGQVSPELKNAFADADGSRVLVLDEFVSDDTLAEAYAAADLVLILHSNEGSSGALAHSLVYGCSVITYGSKIVADAVLRSGCGIVVDDRRPSTLDRATELATSSRGEAGDASRAPTFNFFSSLAWPGLSAELEVVDSR